MAKVYIITEKELDALRERVESVKLRKVEHLNTHDAEKALVTDLFRAFNYEICNWMSEVTKP